MRARGEVSDADWAVLEPLLRFPQRADRRGRPPADTREVLNGVLWILRTGAQWWELPACIRRTKPCMDGSSSGGGAASWRKRCAY